MAEIIPFAFCLLAVVGPEVRNGLRALLRSAVLVREGCFLSAEFWSRVSSLSGQLIPFFFSFPNLFLPFPFSLLRVVSFSFNKWGFLQPTSNMDCCESLGFLMITLSYNVTILGKIWLTLVILLRLMLIFLAAYPLYQDEQERFVCNTLQPGCSNVCYDIFAPVSHFRFWLIQTVSILLPHSIFSVFILHNVTRQVVKASSLPYHRYKEIKALTVHKVSKKLSRSVSRGRVACRANEVEVPDFSGAYTVQLLLRILIEAAFGVGHYYLFGFFVPRHFSCNRLPCSSYVDCYISRPTEKSIMVLFIWGLSGLSFLLSLLDLAFAFRTNAVRNHRNRVLLERFTAEEICNPGVHQDDQLSKDLLGHGVESRSSIAAPDRSGGSLLGCEVKEGCSVQPLLTSQQAVVPNLNSNSNKSCVGVASQEGKGRPFQSSDKQETLPEQSRCGPHSPGTLKGVLTSKSSDGCRHGTHSPTSSNKLSVHYSDLERKTSDAHSVCSGAGCPKSKKSEWV
uniref:Gap junction protein n=1 Tax=Salvator merianae TaxID=96440 RepID=A0A8D0C7L1_SALMN